MCLSKVAGSGSVNISEKLVLERVPLVPNLTYNFFSISKLAKDSGCSTNFYFGGCKL